MAIPLDEVLIGQWRDAPRMRSIAVDVIGGDRDQALAALTALETQSHIDTATGVWLDLLGLRLGLRRPATSDPTQDDRFGYDEAGEPFDQAPFRGDQANDALFPLGDDAFRRLIRARAVTITSSGTAADFERAIRLIDPSAAVQDRRDMTVRVATSEDRLMQLAEDAGALPRPGGVQVRFVDRGRFGYDSAGVPFDQGPFVGAVS